MTIQELQTKRETLIIQITVIKDDLREYTKFPVDTVDVEQIKYQYSYILREIKEIDYKIKTILLSTSTSLNDDFAILKSKVIEKQKEKVFTIDDLPKKHYSFFDEPFY